VTKSAAPTTFDAVIQPQGDERRGKGKKKGHRSTTPFPIRKAARTAAEGEGKEKGERRRSFGLTFLHIRKEGEGRLFFYPPLFFTVTRKKKGGEAKLLMD